MDLKSFRIIDSRHTNCFDIFLRSDGIMHLHVTAEDELSLEDMKESHKMHMELCDGKMFPNLVTFAHSYVPISAEARVFAASEESNKFTICDAIVVMSTALRLGINFYLTFNKPIRPTAVFSSEEKAVEWIKTVIKK